MKMRCLIGLVAWSLAAGGAAQTVTQRKLLDTIGPFQSYGHVYDAHSVEAMRPG